MGRTSEESLADAAERIEDVHREIADDAEGARGLKAEGRIAERVRGE